MHRNGCHHHKNHQCPVTETRCHVAAGDMAPKQQTMIRHHSKHPPSHPNPAHWHQVPNDKQQHWLSFIAVHCARQPYTKMTHNNNTMTWTGNEGTQIQVDNRDTQWERHDELRPRHSDEAQHHIPSISPFPSLLNQSLPLSLHPSFPSLSPPSLLPLPSIPPSSFLHPSFLSPPSLPPSLRPPFPPSPSSPLHPSPSSPSHFSSHLLHSHHYLPLHHSPHSP